MPSPDRLIKKYHHLILCDYEKADVQELTKHLAGCSLVYFSIPKGQRKNFWCQGSIRPSHAAIDVIRALINYHVDLYQEGYTSNGQLSIEDFYWLPRTKSVKVSENTFRDVMDKKTEPGATDFKSLSSTITNKIFRTKVVPKELKHLLEVMTKDPIRHLNLIKHNIVLLEDEEKVSRYIMLHQKLVLAKQLDDKMYSQAIKYLRCGICEDKLRNWQNAVLFHTALLKLFNYKNNKLLPANEEGAALFGRHCCHHLMKYAIEDDKEDDSEQDKQNTGISSRTKAQATNEEGKKKKMKFSLADVFPLLECFIPGLFSQLQEGVFEIIELLYPEDLQTLRSKNTGGA